MPYFVVVRARGPAWDWSKTMRRQAQFDAHAAFMDALAGERFILAGGPLGGEDDAKQVLHIVEAADERTVRARLQQDPWGEEILTTISIEPWTVLLGKLAAEPYE